MRPERAPLADDADLLYHDLLDHMAACGDPDCKAQRCCDLLLRLGGEARREDDRIDELAERTMRLLVAEIRDLARGGAEHRRSASRISGRVLRAALEDPWGRLSWAFHAVGHASALMLASPDPEGHPPHGPRPARA